MLVPHAGASHDRSIASIRTPTTMRFLSSLRWAGAGAKSPEVGACRSGRGCTRPLGAARVARASGILSCQIPLCAVTLPRQCLEHQLGMRRSASGGARRGRRAGSARRRPSRPFTRASTRPPSAPCGSGPARTWNTSAAPRPPLVRPPVAPCASLTHRATLHTLWLHRTGYSPAECLIWEATCAAPGAPGPAAASEFCSMCSADVQRCDAKSLRAYDLHTLRLHVLRKASALCGSRKQHLFGMIGRAAAARAST